MVGWLTKDIEDLGDIVSEFCGHGCANCYYAPKKPFCLGEVYENIKISHANLKNIMILARNDITEFL